MTTILKDLRVNEISLVARGANRRRFLIAKSGELTSGCLAALAGAYESLKGFSDELPSDFMSTLRELAASGPATPVDELSPPIRKQEPDPWSEIERLAGELVQKDGGLTSAQAVDKVLQSDRGRELYRQYIAEKPRPRVTY